MTMAKCSIVVLHLALAASLAACGAKAKAAVVPDGPPLAVPLPPAHEIAVEQIAEAPPQEPPPAPDPVVSIARPSSTAASTPARPESREAQAPTVVAAPAPPAAQPEATAVRASTSAADEQRIRRLLADAANDLNKRVDYRRLSKEGQSQYDQSKRFSEQALQALKEKRFDYALTLAEKAATLAAELVR
jgi:histone H3/H4